MENPLSQMEREMEPGERLVWADGGDAAGRAVAALPTTLFGLAFLAFSIFWMFMAMRQSASAPGEDGSAFPLFGLPFAAVGLFLVLSPLWAWLKHRGAVYGLSDRRAIMVTSFPSRSVSSIFLGDIEDVTRRETWGGRADLILKREITSGSRGRTNVKERGFFGIADARRVEAELSRLRRETLAERNRRSDNA